MSLRRARHLAVGLMGLAIVSAASAQSFNQSLNRYRAAKQDCAAAFERRIERPAPGCVGLCLTAAKAQRDRCLAAAERRYQLALRRALEPRR